MEYLYYCVFDVIGLLKCCCSIRIGLFVDVMEFVFVWCIFVDGYGYFIFFDFFEFYLILIIIICYVEDVMVVVGKF